MLPKLLKKSRGLRQQKNKKLFAGTIIRKIFETNSSFNVK